MQQPKDEIKEKILSEARKEFSNLGYNKTSMRNIALKCGIGVGNIYHYFSSKECLFSTITEHAESAYSRILECRDAIEFWNIIKENRTSLRMLLFKGHHCPPVYQRNENDLACGINEYFKEQFLYILMQELLLHRLKKPEIMNLIQFYLDFVNRSNNHPKLF